MEQFCEVHDTVRLSENVSSLIGETLQTCENNEMIWRANGGEDRCPEKNEMVPIMAAVYLLFTNILLVNLLIAMFRLGQVTGSIPLTCSCMTRL